MKPRNKTLCYFALPTLMLVACVLQPLPSQAQTTSVGVDCSQIQANGITKQDNMRAGRILIECGIMRGGGQAGSGSVRPSAPPNIRASNRACSSDQSCTKSESMAWANTKNETTLVVNYNDHNPKYNSYSGTSYSLDAGTTFTEIQPPPFANGHGTNFGDPLVVFNSKLNKFFAGDLVSGADCGDQGIGLWTSTDGKTWKTGGCPHVGEEDDRPSMWVDNETTSGKYGRMYVSWNDFTTSCGDGGCLFITHSDDGTTWSTPVQLASGSIFIRDVQLTGSPRGAKLFEGDNSTVFVIGMDEGGGGFATRQNLIYKSLDGGVTWKTITMGARFNPPGDATCGYFAQVNPIWRHMGWGEPGVGPNGVVHYAFAEHGTGSDPGDIYYTRSIDNGNTWSKPVKLNTDKDAQFKTQWMPSLSSAKKGRVTVSWYDRRSATSACNNVTDAGCKYERVARQSEDDGKTFLPEFAVSTGLIPEPAQDDPGVVSCYAGDYDYNTTLGGNAFITWTDGTRSVGGTHVEDVDFAKVPEP